MTKSVESRRSHSFQCGTGMTVAIVRGEKFVENEVGRSNWRLVIIMALLLLGNFISEAMQLTISLDRIKLCLFLYGCLGCPMQSN